MKIRHEFLICSSIFVLMAVLPLFAMGTSYSQNEPQTTDASEVLPKAKSQISSSAKSASDNESSETKTIKNKSESSKAEISEISEESFAEVSDDKKILADRKFKILDTSTNEILTLTDEEFLIGAVAVEMPPSYETEALKAQCVAAYTCYAKKRAEERENPHEELRGADFSADLSQKQIYLTPDRMKLDCGDSYDEVYAVYKSVVEIVKDEILTYNGEIITCTYFAISSGKTDSFEDIFGKDLPYLTAVSSPYDVFAPDYKSEKSVSADDFKKAIEKISDEVDFSDKEDKWIGNIELTASGSVKIIEIGDKKFSGAEIRSALGLRSACFEVEYKNGKFVFTVKGYGHNVGMSQYGANEMAKNGSNYRQILEHYYKT